MWAPGTNQGHGHLWERPDGVKARCGGPALCAKCAQDLADREVDKIINGNSEVVDLKGLWT